MSKFEGLYEIRDMKIEDTNFIMATFMNGLYYGDSWFSQIPKKIFTDNYSKVAEAFVSTKNTVIKVACLKEDVDVIIGYSILSLNYQTIHFVYVKEAWRNKGIAKSLTPRYPIAVTHMTALGRILLPKLEGAVFNPFAL